MYFTKWIRYDAIGVVSFGLQVYWDIQVNEYSPTQALIQNILGEIAGIFASTVVGQLFRNVNVRSGRDVEATPHQRVIEDVDVAPPQLHSNDTSSSIDYLHEARFSSDGTIFHGVYGDAPGTTGYPLKRPLTPDEMIQLTQEFNNIEFGLGQEVNPDGSGGRYWLFSGNESSVAIPRLYNNRPMRDIAHTHPSGTQIPSSADISSITGRSQLQIQTTRGPQQLQNIAHIIVATENGGGRAIPYYPGTTPGQYMAPNGPYSQYYEAGGVDYTTLYIRR